MAAPPRSGSATASAAGAAAAPFSPSTSALVIRPRGPVPLTFERSTPSAAATRRATGETWATSLGRASGVAFAHSPGDRLRDGTAGPGSPAAAAASLGALTYTEATV